VTAVCVLSSTTDRARRGPLDTVAVTCVTDGRSHAVREVLLAAPPAHLGGRHQAVCGHLVTPASLVAPDGKPCRLCAAR
jgi:hypothetical protein